MRIASLTFSIAAPLLLLGVAGQASALPSCADQNLPDFAKDLNKNAAWNSYVSQTLNNPAKQWPGYVQLRDGFKTAQCAAAWGRGKMAMVYSGISQRSCTFDAPTPAVSAPTPQAPGNPTTIVNYLATPTNMATLHLRGCGTPMQQLPAELAR